MINQDIQFQGGTRVLLWRLDEQAPQLLALCWEQGIFVEDLTDMPVKRQQEKAVERLLLCRAFGHPVSLSHDEQGAPFVEGSTMNVSITHTMRLVALALNDSHVVGLDAEQCDRQQVLRVRNKFLNASEQQFIGPDDLAAHIIAWTAKEAVIKAERNSAIDWTDGIRLEPFLPTPDVSTLIAHCGAKRYQLITRSLEGHYLTIATPAPQTHSAGQ